MAKRVYWEGVRKEQGAAAGAGFGTVALMLFAYLAASGAITVHDYSGDMVCAGTKADPCFYEVNFTANEDIFVYPMGYDPYGRDSIAQFDDTVKSIEIMRSWGKGWRTYDLRSSCSASWCGAEKEPGKYSLAWREGKNYTVRVYVEKHDPGDRIKWSFGDVDPYFLPAGYSMRSFTSSEGPRETIEYVTVPFANRTCGNVSRLNGTIEGCTQYRDVEVRKTVLELSAWNETPSANLGLWTALCDRMGDSCIVTMTGNAEYFYRGGELQGSSTWVVDDVYDVKSATKDLKSYDVGDNETTARWEKSGTFGDIVFDHELRRDRNKETLTYTPPNAMAHNLTWVVNLTRYVGPNQVLQSCKYRYGQMVIDWCDSMGLVDSAEIDGRAKTLRVRYAGKTGLQYIDPVLVFEVNAQSDWQNFTFNGTSVLHRVDSSDAGLGQLRLGGNRSAQGREALTVLSFDEAAAPITDDGRLGLSWSTVGSANHAEVMAYNTSGIRVDADDGFTATGPALVDNWTLMYFGNDTTRSGSDSAFWDTSLFFGQGGTTLLIQLNGGTGTGVTLTNPIPTGYYWVAASYNTDGNWLRLWVNGVNVGSSNPSAGQDIGTNWQVFTRNGGDGYEGAADELMIFNVTLSAGEMLDVIGNRTTTRLPQALSDCMDATSSRDWAEFNMTRYLGVADINATVCSYSDSACTADESCANPMNASGFDISAISDSQYARVRFEFHKNSYRAASHVDNFSLSRASDPESVVQSINLTRAGGHICATFPAFCNTTDDRRAHVNITLDIDANLCRVSFSDESFTDMTTNCTTGGSATVWSCSAPSNISVGNDTLYYACNSTTGTSNSAPLAAAHKMNVTVYQEIKGSTIDLNGILQNITVCAHRQENNQSFGCQFSTLTGNFSFNVTTSGNYTIYGYNRINASTGGAIEVHLEAK